MNEPKSENKLSEIIRTSLDNIRSMVDANTVIGDPIHTSNGTVIIPVSKLMVGFASGGLDYIGKNAEAAEGRQKDKNFGGGGGTGLTVAPVGFLIIGPDGSVELLNISNPVPPAADPVSQLISLVERSPELIDRFKAVCSKKSDGDASDGSAQEQP